MNRMSVFEDSKVFHIFQGGQITLDYPRTVLPTPASGLPFRLHSKNFGETTINHEIFNSGL